MTSKITVAAPEVRVNDHIYNGTGTNAHPTFAWESVTEVRMVDGLILLITGNLKGPHGEFWLEPDEQIGVIRHPESTTVETEPTKANTKHGHK
jgi:hypothetical protein